MFDVYTCVYSDATYKQVFLTNILFIDAYEPVIILTPFCRSVWTCPLARSTLGTPGLQHRLYSGAGSLCQMRYCVWLSGNSIYMLCVYAYNTYVYCVVISIVCHHADTNDIHVTYLYYFDTRSYIRCMPDPKQAQSSRIHTLIDSKYRTILNTTTPTTLPISNIDSASTLASKYLKS